MIQPIFIGMYIYNVSLRKEGKLQLHILYDPIYLKQYICI